MHDFIITIIRDHHIWYTYLESSQRMGVPGLKRQFFGMSKTRNVSATRNLLSFVDWRSYMPQNTHIMYMYMSICHYLVVIKQINFSMFLFFSKLIPKSKIRQSKEQCFVKLMKQLKLVFVCEQIKAQQVIPDKVKRAFVESFCNHSPSLPLNIKQFSSESLWKPSYIWRYLAKV